MIRLGRRLVRRLWPRGRRARAVSAGVAVVVAAAVAGGVAAASGPGPVTARHVRISVTDGPHDDQHVVLDATFFTPSGTGRVPSILLAHGFGETKDDVRPEAESLAQAGFAVLTWSARGFGASTGQIALDSPDYEVKDVEGLSSWLAAQPQVLLDHPGDPRVGIAGDSYGGGIALLAAAYDHRIDAVVAQSTWNNLATALFPDAAAGGSPADGVFKRQWASLLFTAGAGAGGSGRAEPGAGGPGAAGLEGTGGDAGGSLCGRFLPSICAMYQQVALTGIATPQAIATLDASSPSSVASRMTAPTLLVQGEQDSLFGLDQADANYEALRRNGTPADMVLVRGRARRRQPGDCPGRRPDRSLVPPLAGRQGRARENRPSASQHKAAGVRGDPDSRARPDGRLGIARSSRRRRVPRPGRDPPAGRSPLRPRAGGGQPSGRSPGGDLLAAGRRPGPGPELRGQH